jgi:hypothetical protein
MLSKIASLFISMLEDENRFDYFLGGSRRFGYDTPKSDFDFFLHGEGDGEPLQHFLYRNGFSRVFPNEDYKFSEHWRIVIGGSHIDAIILPSNEFHALRNEHALVEKVMCKFPSNAINFIRVMKRLNGVSGSDVYRALKSACL